MVQPGLAAGRLALGAPVARSFSHQQEQDHQDQKESQAAERTKAPTAKPSGASQLANVRAVSEMTSLSRATTYELARKGAFPAPVQLADRRVVGGNPPRDYFAAAEQQWDGIERLDTWLTKYAGTEDTELSCLLSFAAREGPARSLTAS